MLLINKNYIIINFLSIIIFAFLYYSSDYFIINYSKLIKKIKLYKNEKINTNENTNENTKENIKEKNKGDTFLYYLWFSFITQTTIGYSNIVNRNGKEVHYITNKSKLYLFFNFLQLISIIVIASLFI